MSSRVGFINENKNLLICRLVPLESAALSVPPFPLRSLLFSLCLPAPSLGPKAIRPPRDETECELDSGNPTTHRARTARACIRLARIVGIRFQLLPHIHIPPSLHPSLVWVETPTEKSKANGFPSLSNVSVVYFPFQPSSSRSSNRHHRTMNPLKSRQQRESVRTMLVVTLIIFRSLVVIRNC